MKIGIGYSNGPDSFSLGKNVAENAIKNGKIDAPAMIIAFCGGGVDHDAYFRGLQTPVGEKVPIIGGSAIGIITNEHLSYDGFPAGAAIIESDTLEHIEGSANNLHKNEKRAGQQLAEKLSNTIDGNLLLMFYDSIKISPCSNLSNLFLKKSNTSFVLVNSSTNLYDLIVFLLPLTFALIFFLTNVVNFL